MRGQGNPHGAPEIRAARDANADYVTFGNAQVLGSQLRVTGQVLDARTGQTVSPLKVTAPVDNLFPLEDALAAQAARAISPTSAASLPKARWISSQPPIVSRCCLASDTLRPTRRRSVSAN